MLAVTVKTLILSLCWSLPVIGAFVVYFATGWTTFTREDLEYGYTLLSRLFVLMWPASIPLSLALVLLHRRSRPAACLCGALLIPPSLFGFIVAGLLQMELAAILVAAFSLPAWGVLLAVSWRRRQA